MIEPAATAPSPVRASTVYLALLHRDIRVAMKELPVHDGKHTVIQALLYVACPLLSHTTRKQNGPDFRPRLEEIGEIIGSPNGMRVCSLREGRYRSA